ncbi:uncharacterized protein LTR77_010818 [Saxophila tyrrhenica]|uniref:Uncharacterized protein n=1 Tax=Saxophila tyrrhenica TaxID=1690608 RepID=A0AAV9NU98_9PEZI|nr:hypothetical protein LTR77_010818 [Saxophila tyrrhenica]
MATSGGSSTPPVSLALTNKTILGGSSTMPTAPDLATTAATTTTSDSMTDQAQQDRLQRAHHNATKCRLLTLPPELRNRINEEVIASNKEPHVRVPHHPGQAPEHFSGMQLTQVCQRMCNDILPMLWAQPIVFVLHKKRMEGHASCEYDAAATVTLDSGLFARDLSRLFISYASVSLDQRQTTEVYLEPDTPGTPKKHKHECMCGGGAWTTATCGAMIQAVNDWNAKLRSRDVEGTGLTEDVVRKMIAMVLRD